jgi:hypothetical protein
MSSRTSEDIEPQLDLSDVDHRVGQLVGGGQLIEPCSTTDIRRWVMAMDYPNPIQQPSRPISDLVRMRLAHRRKADLVCHGARTIRPRTCPRSTSW